jgi:AcrR family transcriptional regulator
MINKEKNTSKKDDNTESTKERIFNISVDLFSKKGFDAVSMREIGREVGIRESSIYNHYKNKEAILDAIIDFFFSEIEASSLPDEEMDGLLSMGPETFFEAGAKLFIERMSTPKTEKIWRIISIEVFHNEKIRKLFVDELLEAPINAWEVIFTKMMEKNLIKKYDPKILAREYFSFAIYLYFEYFILKYDTDYKSFMDLAWNKMAEHAKFILESIKIEEE